MRYTKRDAAMYDADGDREAFEQAVLKVKENTAKLKNFVSKHASLVLSNDRTWVSGYNRSVSGKMTSVSRKYSGYRYRKDGTI